MSFKLGNFTVAQVLYAVAQSFNDEILYTLDQLSSASIELNAEGQEINDKKGNLVRMIYRSKTGTFNSVSAMLHPEILNATTGSEIEIATPDNPIEMPRILTVAAGQSVKLKNFVDETLQVAGVYKNGANGDTLYRSVTPSLEDKTYGLVGDVLTVPAKISDDDPSSYIVKYQRIRKTGMKITNNATKFPKTIRLTLLCSIVDPCDDSLKPAYVYLPSFTPDPNVTISLSAEEQEIDYNGTIQMSYCGENKAMYYIFFPDENLEETEKLKEIIEDKWGNLIDYTWGQLQDIYWGNIAEILGELTS